MSPIFTSILRHVPLSSAPPPIPPHLTPADLAHGYPGSGGPPPPPEPPGLPSLRSLLAQLRQRVPAGEPGGGRFLPNPVRPPALPPGPPVSPTTQFALDQINLAEALGQQAEAERLRRNTIAYFLNQSSRTHGFPTGTTSGGLPPGAGLPTLQPPPPGPRPSVGEVLEKGLIKTAITVEAIKQTAEGAKGLISPNPQSSSEDFLNATRVTVGPTVAIGTLPVVGSAAAGVTVAIPFTLGYVVYALRKEKESLEGLPADAQLSTRDPINLSPQALLDLQRKNALVAELERQVAKEQGFTLFDPATITGPVRDC